MMESYSTSKRKDALTPATAWLDLVDMLLSNIRVTKGQILHDATHTRSPEESESQRQEVDGRVLCKQSFRLGVMVVMMVTQQCE